MSPQTPRPGRVRRALESVWSRVLAHGLSGVVPLFIVNEYPKAGGTWVGQMLAAALEVPFPRNRIPPLGRIVLHGHFIRPFGMRNVIVVWRDGRDVMVSWYHHCLFEHERGNSEVVQRTRRELGRRDFADVAANLPDFIEYCFTAQRSPRFSWAEFVRVWHGRPGAVHVRYERVHRDPAAELRRIVLELTGRALPAQKTQAIAQAYSFAQQSGRDAGRERKNAFLRKGIVGDWRNHFTPEACRVFDRHAGEELLRLGYEPDRSWIRERPD